MDNDTTIHIEEEGILYSEKFTDDSYEYRYVTLPHYIASLVVPGYLMSEREWRVLGIQMSSGWLHCGSHLNSPHVLWFRRPLFLINTPFISNRQEKRPRLTKSAGDLPGLKQSLLTVDTAATVLQMRRLVAPNPKGFEKRAVDRNRDTALDLPLFNLSLKQPAPSRTVSLRSSLQTHELLRL